MVSSEREYAEYVERLETFCHEYQERLSQAAAEAKRRARAGMCVNDAWQPFDELRKWELENDPKGR
jgi:hypothetical protein